MYCLGFTSAEGVATPRTDDMGGPKASQISELRRTAKWRDPPEVIERKSTVGGIIMWSGQFVKAWSKMMGVLALSSGESELAAVVRAGTVGLGLQSILSDFGLCGHVAIKSDGTAALGMVHRFGLGKVRHMAVGDLWFQHHVRPGKIRVSKMSGLEIPSDARTKYFGPEPLQRHSEACKWVLVDGKVQSTTKVGQ